MALRVVRAAILVALVFSLTISPTIAHAALVSATPGPGDEVIGSPSALVARFSQDLVESRTSLQVRDASGATAARGGVIGGTPREFRLDLPLLPPGTYQVRYTTYSAEDGELHRDTYEFTVVAEPSPSASPDPSTPTSASPTESHSAAPNPSAMATPNQSPGPGGDPSEVSDTSVLIPIFAALALVAGIGWWLLRRRST